MKPIRIAFLSLFALSTVAASAQYLNTAYFIDGYSYRHQMNPAFMSERNYLSLPLFGNTTVALKSNVGIDDFIYKNKSLSSNRLTTFMHPSVNTNSFLSNLKRNNRNESYVNANIISIGMYGKKGFNTFELNVRGSSSLNLPYELFDFMKSGMKAGEGTIYRIENLKASAISFAEFAVGHAKKVNDNLTVGAKFKLLFGFGHSEASVDNLTALMSQGKWSIIMNGRINTSMKNVAYKTKQEELTQRQIDINKMHPGMYKPRDNQFDGFDIDSPSLSGLGAAIDLGFVCDMNEIAEGLKFSVSLLDLGFIRWDNNLQASNNGNKGFLFNGFSEVGLTDDGSSKTIKDQVGDLTDQLEEMVKFYDEGDKGKRTTTLSTTMNVGLEYNFNEKVSTGLLSSTHFHNIYTWTEIRLSLNMSPTRWFDASASFAKSTFGSEAGAVINFHPRGLNFFVGTNRIFTKTTKEFIPMNGNADITFGINFTFGKKQAKATPAAEILPPIETPAPTETSAPAETSPTPTANTPPPAETENNISE